MNLLKELQRIDCHIPVIIIGEGTHQWQSSVPVATIPRYFSAQKLKALLERIVPEMYNRRYGGRVLPLVELCFSAIATKFSYGFDLRVLPSELQERIASRLTFGSVPTGFTSSTNSTLTNILFEITKVYNATIDSATLFVFSSLHVSLVG